MIYFPPPFPDELLYSVSARYHARSGNENTKMTMRDLFGKKTVCAVTDLPGHLQQLHSLIPGNAISVATLLEEHTLLPYFQSFIPSERYTWIVEEMIYGEGQSIYMKMGLPPSGVIKPSYLRYCPACVELDRGEYGIAYWHRSHQLSGVSVCSTHNLFLVSSSILYAQRRNKHEFIMLESIVDDERPSLTRQGGENEFLIATRSTELLQMNKQYIGQDSLRKKYLQRLAQRGMLTARGNIKFRELLPDFISFYGKDYLHTLGCSIDEDRQHTWLHKMLRKPRHAVHPLRHLLVQIYLKIDLGNYEEESGTASINPFGEGPWPCLNKVAMHYREEVIDSVCVTRCYNTGRPVGTFICGCGFTYSRRGPDSNVKDNDKLHIGRIKQFGPVWIDKLKELNKDKTLGLREKARRLGVDPGTIKKQTEKLETNIPIISHKLPALLKPLNRSIKIYSKKQVGKKWTRVDWSARDELLAQEIDRVVNDVKKSNKHPVSKNEVGRLLNCSTMLRTKLDKLPCTSERLNMLTRKGVK